MESIFASHTLTEIVKTQKKNVFYSVHSLIDSV